MIKNFLSWMSDCSSVHSIWKLAGNIFMSTENGITNTTKHWWFSKISWNLYSNSCIQLKSKAAYFSLLTRLLLAEVLKCIKLFALTWAFHYFSLKKLLLNYNCPHYPLLLSPALPTINPPTHCLCQWVIYTCSLTWFFPFFPLCSSPTLWSLSDCSLLPHLWIYFARLFILFIRFYL